MKKKLSLLMTFMLCFAIGAWADTYTVAGAVLGGDGSESPGFFLSYWDINYPGNDMEEQEGVFVKKYENLELEQCRILFKVRDIHPGRPPSDEGRRLSPPSAYQLLQLQERSD